MSEHTPGPWRVKLPNCEIKADIPANCPEGSYSIIVADCFGYMHPTQNRNKQGCRHANARLIAAAPDMLTALEDAACQIDFKDGNKIHHPRCSRCAAIKAAKGDA